jgi:hypothetical protein
VETKHLSRMVCKNPNDLYIYSELTRAPMNSGCDLKSYLYSFSFNQNPNWSKELCDQPEILQCKVYQSYHRL